MGVGYSTTTTSLSSSYQQYQNDFELVIRATKDLEYLLETSFGVPSGKQIGLHDKITHVQSTEGLSRTTVQKMRYLVTLRNKLVHQHDFNELPDRVSFATSYESVEQELKQRLHERSGGGGGGDSSCIIS
mmetsp:Transcript_13296/g.18541  ORF Transcript_13296/g.18541 Transcript_13296/m.18541 type:complete len:130 (-) Transcript_13296:50-439(-)